MANLRGFIGTTDTTIQVDDTTALPVNNGVVQVESEKIFYTNATDKALVGCTRGALSTSAAAHADKTPLTDLSDSVFNAGVIDFNDASAPTDLITGRGIAKKGDRYTNSANGNVYVNTGTLAAPVWTLLSTGGSGITALTGDVTASGSGSVAAIVALVGGASSTQIANAVLGKSTVGTLTGTGTVTPNASVANTFTMTVSGAVTLNGPSNPTSGQKVLFVITNDASHSVTLATGSGNFAFGTDITSYTNSVSKVDLLEAIWNSTASRWYVAAISQGF